MRIGRLTITWDRSPQVSPDPVLLAPSACEIITDIMGEIHAARITGAKAITQPVLFQTAHPRYIVRTAIGTIALALRKFDDLWLYQIRSILLKDSSPGEGIELHRELERKRIRAFCNRVVAHYAETYVSPKTPLTKIEELLTDQGFQSDLDFFKWTCRVLETVEYLRTLIGSKHHVDEALWKK